MAVLSHEGIYPIMYGTWPIPIGAAHRDGYIARPDEAGEFPVVVLIPDLDGLGSLEKDICRRLARSGLAAVAVDFYPEAKDSLTGYTMLDDNQALADLDELYEFISSQDVEWNVSKKFGLLGIDTGGRFALAKAATRDWVASAAVVYSPLTGDEDRGFQVADYLDHLPVPILGLYGAEDDLIDPSSVDEAQRRNEHGQWLLYDGARHGFLNIEGERYDAAATEDAIARLVAFFIGSLAPAEVEDLG